VAATPLVVVGGETDPQGVAEQDTVQLTPLFAASLVTVAVTCTLPPAGTVEGSSATDTVKRNWLPPSLLLLLPPHAAMAIVSINSRHRTEENVERFTTPPCGQPEWTARCPEPR